MPGHSRRTFLERFASGTAFYAGAATTLSGLNRALAAAPEGEAYWQTIRRQFDFDESHIPMNAANLCPSPRVVAERVTQLTRDIDMDCSSQNRAKFGRLLEETRGKVARQLGVTADEIALVRNTSEANNTINAGVPLKAGDEIVLWDQNHPTNNVAWDVRAARYHLAIKRVSTPRQPADADELVSVFERAFTPKTRLLAITHTSNNSGLRLPVRELCEVAHRRGIYVHVDGAQTWGALHVNLREMGCDSYSASGHKWYVGPKEVGLLYVRASRIPEVWPHTVAPGWGDDAEPDVKGARKFESLGQRDDACLAALGTAADFHDMIGPSRVEARVLQLASTLKKRLAGAGVKLATPSHPSLSAGVLVVEVPAANRQTVIDRLYKEFGIAAATPGGLRLCPHLYNTLEHLDRAVEGVKALRGLLS
ncbi:MAG TPA: aminotransferase class V-fold PLP-dependent enzyme [Bryobacteraceae bacterium]|nr:aminotransferase class V-fold PLP-dependent enzyme [Bryobacteraceae bacterium]